MKDTIANLQAARDRLMPKVTACWGDAFDGDFDSMLEAINEMKRYHANIDADRAEFLQLAAQRAELLEIVERLSAGERSDTGHTALRDDATELLNKYDANATQQRNPQE